MDIKNNCSLDRHKVSHRDAHQSNECGFMSAKQWHLMPAKAIDAVFEQNHILADAWFCRKTEKLRLQINKIRVRHHEMTVFELMSLEFCVKNVINLK